VLVDKLYWTRENIRYCQERGIRITGPRLGRKNPQIHKEERKIMVQDARIRNAVTQPNLARCLRGLLFSFFQRLLEEGIRGIRSNFEVVPGQNPHIVNQLLPS